MNSLWDNIQIKVNRHLYLKDPESSEIGKAILQHSILMIAENGLEAFTFRKLAQSIGTTEASIYRYFENKHKLLHYIINWYWAWTEHALVFAIQQERTPKKRLEKALQLVCNPADLENAFPHIDEKALNELVIRESSKSYLHHSVDDDNQLGAFSVYKRVVQRIADVCLEINPRFKSPHALVSTAIEGAHHQRYFAQHLPSLTDFKDDPQAICSYFQKWTYTLLQA